MQSAGGQSVRERAGAGKVQAAIDVDDFTCHHLKSVRTTLFKYPGPSGAGDCAKRASRLTYLTDACGFAVFGSRKQSRHARETGGI
jgi:hypothetical protein